MNEQSRFRERFQLRGGILCLIAAGGLAINSLFPGVVDWATQPIGDALESIPGLDLTPDSGGAGGGEDQLSLDGLAKIVDAHALTA